MISQMPEKLVDEISLVYFNARKVYQEDQSLSTFYSNIRNLHINYSFREVEEHIAKYGTRGFIIMGDGDKALYNYLVLVDGQYNVVGVFSGDGSFSFTDAQKLKEEELVYLTLEKNYAAVINKEDIVKYENVLSRIEDRNKFVVQDHVVGRCGVQYFDYFTPRKKEVFIDGGSLDGSTTDAFINWCGGEYEYVYAFEPNPKMVETCREHFAGYEKVNFVDCALWKEQTVLSFDNSSSKWDAHVSQMGNTTVHANTIDNIVGMNHVTLIKLDVEGSEMEALQGAKMCIQRDVPRLAISIYHKPKDMEEIGTFLLALVPDYMFSIRHYHSDAIESILYAFKE